MIGEPDKPYDKVFDFRRKQVSQIIKFKLEKVVVLRRKAAFMLD